MEAATLGQIGNYRIVEKIACGSFGCVYRAEHVFLKRTVAIKLLHTAHLASQQERDGFLKEAQLLEMLKHPLSSGLFSKQWQKNVLFAIRMFLFSSDRYISLL